MYTYIHMHMYIYKCVCINSSLRDCCRVHPGSPDAITYIYIDQVNLIYIYDSVNDCCFSARVRWVGSGQWRCRASRRSFVADVRAVFRLQFRQHSHVPRAPARRKRKRIHYVLGLCNGTVGLPKPLSDQFPVRVCSCPLCI